MKELDPGLIADVIRLFESEDLDELVVEEPGLRIAVRRDVAVQAPAPLVAAPRPPTTPAGARDAAEPEDPEAAGHVAIASPIGGVFYRTPTPGGRSYVEVGDEVEEGHVVGIVEAMKVMNEITAHVHGTITRIEVRNEEVVAVGQVLMWVQPI